jgi:hypothetical protein
MALTQLMFSLFLLLFPSVLIHPLLKLFGFGPLGPQAASFAAFVQSWIGNVPRYGIFAFLQSAGMNGYGFAWTKNMMRIGATILLRKMAAR